MKEFKWNIRNIEMSPLQYGKYIQSPPFSFKKFEFCLRLYPRGFEPEKRSKLMFLILHRCDKGLENIEVMYHLSMCCNGFNSSKTYCGFKSALQTHFLQKLDKDRSLTISRSAIVAVLNVTCKILFYSDVNCKEQSEQEDLAGLSAAFAILSHHGTSSDLRLHIGNKDFNVHKAILAARSQSLSEQLQTHVCTQTYSPSTIQQLILYLYSGQIDYSNVPDELYILLGKLDINLAKQICTLNYLFICAETSIQVITISFPLRVEYFEISKSITNVICVTDGPMWCWFKFIFIVNGPDKCMLIIHRLNHDINIFVRCKITLECGTVLCEYGYLFHNEEECKIPIDSNNIRLQEKKSAKKDLKLLVHIDVSSGEQTTNIRETVFAEHVSEAEQFHSLSEDFLKLFKSSKLSDVIVKAREAEFKVHKAILSARSPVFNKMFLHDCTENKNAEVIIEDIKEDVVSSMLCYMYCGKLPKLDTDLAIDLYYAANKYQISMLERKCSTFLQSPISLNPENAGLILHVADIHSDENLKKCVCDFVCRNAKQVMVSEEWKKVMKNQPGLASDVLEAVLGFVAENIPEKNDSK